MYKKNTVIPISSKKVVPVKRKTVSSSPSVPKKKDSISTHKDSINDIYLSVSNKNITKNNAHVTTILQDLDCNSFQYKNILPKCDKCRLNDPNSCVYKSKRHINVSQNNVVENPSIAVNKVNHKGTTIINEADFEPIKGSGTRNEINLLQTDSCNQLPLADTEICMDCSSNQEDNCRFKNYKVLQLGPTGRYICVGFKIFRPVCNKLEKRDILSAEIDCVLKWISITSERVLQREWYFVEFVKSFYRDVEEGYRHLCDLCNTTIFCGFLHCVRCGIEVCIDCFYDKLVEKSVCKRSKNNFHCDNDFRACHKIDPEMLRILLDVLKSIPSIQPMVPVVHPFTSSPVIWTSLDEFSLRYNSYSIEETDALNFNDIWKEKTPIKVTGLDGHHNRDIWRPEYFIAHHGHETTDMVDCNTGKVIKGLDVQTFFAGFLDSAIKPKQDGKELALKLTDWPESDHFKEKFPLHYKDFMDILPFPEFTTLDGAYNLANKLPSKYVPPDLGPKMYNAYGTDISVDCSYDGPNGNGTTPLHVDVADAVNVLMYSSAAHGSVCAVWHIFQPCDAPAIKLFGQKYASERGLIYSDLIHDHSFYITYQMRLELHRTFGVRAFVIEQYCGDAIFIPAGHPHQVCNLTNSIKVAVDFVSPHNVAACLDLTEEFRKLPATHRYSNDALQIKPLLFHNLSHYLLKNQEL